MMMIHGSLKAGTTKTASCAFEKISIKSYYTLIIQILLNQGTLQGQIQHPT